MGASPAHESRPDVAGTPAMATPLSAAIAVAAIAVVITALLDDLSGRRRPPRPTSA